MISCPLAVVPTVDMLVAALVHVIFLFLKIRSDERCLLDARGAVDVGYSMRTGSFVTQIQGARGLCGTAAVENSPALCRDATGARWRGGAGAERRSGFFQGIMAVWEKIHPYNAAQILRLKGRAEPDRLRESIEKATREAGVGALTVAADGCSYRYEPAGAAEIRDAVTCTIVPRGGALGVLEAALTAEMNRRFGEGRHPVRWTVLDDPATGTHYLMAAYRHLAADSVSMRVLLRRVLNRHFGSPVEGDEEALDVAPPEAAFLFRRPWRRLRFLRMLGRSGRLCYRLSRVHRFCESEDGGEGETCRLFKTPQGFAGSLALACRARGVTVNDACASALISTLAEMTPLRSGHARRRGLALATIADLRGEAEKDLSKAFGLYLGQSVIVVQEPDRLDFEDLLRRISCDLHFDKNRKAKRFVGPQWNFWLAARLRNWLPYENSRAWYRRVWPLSAGLSDVRLDASWFGEGGTHIAEYFRAAPCGPAAPLVLTLTTFQGELTLGLTWHDSTWTAAQADRLMELLNGKLQGLL